MLILLRLYKLGEDGNGQLFLPLQQSCFTTVADKCQDFKDTKFPTLRVRMEMLKNICRLETTTIIYWFLSNIKKYLVIS